VKLSTIDYTLKQGVAHGEEDHQKIQQEEQVA
jgi:hypothetical protein